MITVQARNLSLYSENNIAKISFSMALTLAIHLLKILKAIFKSKDKKLRNGEGCFSTSHFFNNSAKRNTTLRGLLFSLFFVTHLTTSAYGSSTPIKQKRKHVQFPCKKKGRQLSYERKDSCYNTLIQKFHLRRYLLYTKHRSLHPSLFVNCRF